MPIKIIISVLFIITLTNKSIKAQNSGIESAGDIGLIAIPLAALSTTIIKGDKEGIWQFTKGFLLNELVTFGLKYTINKERPDFSNNNSFPSGHTSTVFHGASFIHRRYGFKHSIPAYAVASFTAFSRIKAKKHDAIDVLAGVIIGIGSASIFTTEYQQEHMELSFNNDNGYYSIGFSYKF